MCLKSDHREIETLLRQRDLTIEQQLARITELTSIISGMEIPPRPEIELFPISRNEVSNELRALGVELIHHALQWVKTKSFWSRQLYAQVYSRARGHHFGVTQKLD